MLFLCFYSTWLAFFVLDIDILHGRKIIFEDVKSTQLEQQIKFNGMPFVVLGCKNMDCTYGKDHAISRKIKAKSKKMKDKVV